ncbi:mannitol dehydrogenase family protein [Microbacterium sp. KSW4-17]|uniref:Mannitol-1-phosphate 5-dehydrogenase n=1 Tax=Microbacterium galbum TaxID=3075994 RepID=A0ABU3T5M7_9MICO|nr:mannitol dehydrogenase family protein [Microbacterium sp. KSW4-17]MDU0366615.1 mannitol dehydrogenase family protein [Microbacterium sp. KSW4-17]
MPIIDDPFGPTASLHRGARTSVASSPAPRAAGILHLGLGSFHRAHQAVYTAAALRAEGGDWGIVGVASRSRRVVDALHAQDHLYAVATVSPEATTLDIPGVHTDSYVAAADPARVVADLSDPRIRIVTLTVTENGYSFSPSTQHLDVTDPRVQADLRGGAPMSTVAQLARGLQARASAGGAPLSILSCDNLLSNGSHTEKLVREFLQELPDAEGSDVLTYLDRAVTFPSSMVDRIVPSTTAELTDRVAGLLGVRDEVPVPAEPFTMWAIEDRFAGGRPAWEAGGAVFTDEVGAYEQLKVRLLNGTHSLIAYLGALRGVPTIPDAIALADIEAAAAAVLRGEYEPSVTAPAGVDIEQYERDLFARWGNSALGHRTSQVGSDGSVKLGQRIPGPIAHALDRGEFPHLIALTVAAYLACVAPPAGFDPGPHAEAMTDPARERLTAVPTRDGRDLAHRAIVDLRLFGDDVAHRTAFVDRVGDLVDTIVRRGVESAIADSLAAAGSLAHPAT